MNETKRLIVVDDEPEFCTFVADCAALLGYEVTKLLDPRGFEAAFEGVKPDALVIDMVMPYRDGFDLLESLSDSDRNLKVILVTGFLPAYTRSAGARLEMMGFTDVWALNKPFGLDELCRALGPAEAETKAKCC